MEKQEILNKISELLDNYGVPNEIGKLELEDHNFRINSDGWKKITVDDNSYLVNETGDIWEIFESGEQLFTWESAVRETEKAGKRMPTDEEFNEFEKEDFKNIVYAGNRNTDGSFSSFGSHAGFWSVSPDSTTTAWNRSLRSGYAAVYRYYNAKANGFSVRCLKN